MSIRAEIQSLSPSALIELFVLDLSLQGGSTLYWHAGTNGLSADIIWGAQAYARYPIEAQGFKMSGTGALPRPKLSASNAQGILGALARQYNDFAGCKLTRIRTFARFLDAANFPGGVNPTADPTQELPRQIWFVDRKAQETPQLLQFDLASALDMVAVKLPRRQFIQNACPWVYRGADCGYTGGAVADAAGNPTADPAQDVCGKRLSDCALRFAPPALMNFGGFPGCGIGTS
ncbi:phage minor tail protein L [Pandoraea pnomenusa]|uniref:phage minor tail protein L n=1 Tax=Pandoraea pnomenusa TaxID=93220 RepID=UPI0003D2081E|nr:phage minor tail protein L [Pandoraea pnomenusa]AHB77250.1 phage minor tail protein L [Pandoraea pnomenusa]MDA8260342.1 phage minor tail protein L [Betaproteobacteria bacterium]